MNSICLSLDINNIRLNLQRNISGIFQIPALGFKKDFRKIYGNFKFTGSVFDVVAGGLAGIGAMLEEYHRLTIALKHTADDAGLRRLDILHDKIEKEKGWQTNQQLETILTRLSLDPNLAFETLSVGFKRRVLFARALVAGPGILLLDEPTTQLNITPINRRKD